MDDFTPTLSVLIVEDCPDTAYTTAQILDFEGHTPRIAHCAEDAYALAEVDPPDVVLLDIYLPRINGCEVAKRLAKICVAMPPFVIVISGSTKESDRKRMMEAGCHLYLVKPVDPAVLCGLMRRLSRALVTMEEVAV